MEQLYSIGTTNRYAMFIGDEDDPGDVIIPSKSDKEISTSTKPAKIGKDTSKQSKNVKGKDNKEKVAEKNKVVVLENTNKTSAPDKPNSAGRQKQGTHFNDRSERQGERLDNRHHSDDRPPRSGRGERQRLPSKDKDRENDSGSTEDRQTRGRGPRPFKERGSGGGRGGFRSGKREFERRSGSDKSSIKPVDKRDGGGAHNWGRQGDAAVDEWPNEESEAQLDTQEPVANGEDVQEQKEQAEGEEGEGEEPPQEEGPKEMTLDEYKAQHNVETLKPDTSLQRNVDNSQWKGTVALKKENEEFFPGTREVIEKPKTSGRIKTTLDPNFYFKDQARRGRGRTGGPGGRGSGLSREDRGGNRRNFDDNRRDGGRGGGRREFDGGRRDLDGGRREFDGGRKEFEGGRKEFEGRRKEFEGGRREFEGRRGFGRGRSNNRRERAPNVEDESDFPSLGAF